MMSYELHDLHNDMYETKCLRSITSVVNLSKTLMSWHETRGWWWIFVQLQDMQKATSIQIQEPKINKLIGAYDLEESKYQ